MNAGIRSLFDGHWPPTSVVADAGNLDLSSGQHGSGGLDVKLSNAVRQEPRFFRGAGVTVLLLTAVLVSCSESEGSSPSRDIASGSGRMPAPAVTAAGCPGCIILDTLVELGTPQGDGILSGPLHVAIDDASGRYWVQDRDILKVYAPDGSFISQVGRTGEGPGEFGAPVPIHADADGSVHVLDPANLRITVLDSSFQVVSETHITNAGPVHEAAWLAEDRYMVAMWSGGPESVGFPLHVLSDEGIILRSFGMPDGEERLDPFTAQRRITANAAGQMFATPRFIFRVESWNSEAEPLATFMGPALIQHAVEQAPYNLDDHPIPAEIMDLHADFRGRLWVLIREPREGWETLFEEQAYPNGMVGLRLRGSATIDDVYRSRLWVVSLTTGDILADTVMNGQLTGFTPSGLIVENGESPAGDPLLRILRALGPD